MKYSLITSLLAFLISFFSVPTFAEEGVWADVKQDYGEFYSADRLIRMGIVFTGGAILAHTDFDQNFQDRNLIFFQLMTLSV